MVSPAQADINAQLTFLKVEEQALEAQLAELRSAMAALRAQRNCILHPQEGMRAPLSHAMAPSMPGLWENVSAPAPLHGREQSPNPPITLQPLHPHDPLHAKWKLGRGLSTATSRFAPLSSLPTATKAFGPKKGHGRQLHLAGKLGGGHPWECRIPFSDLARPGGMTLGRAPHEADIVLPDDSASRRHAQLEVTEAGLVITDLGSTNGTYINGRLLSPYELRTRLEKGATLHIGETQLRVDYT